MSIYNSVVDHEILKLSFGFNDHNSILYDFIVSYFYRNKDNNPFPLSDNTNYKLLFTDLIPNRLFSDTIQFIATKHNTSLSSQIMNTIIELPVFKKLKKDNNYSHLQPDDEKHIVLLKTMYESYYQLDPFTTDISHMCFPKATFDRLMQILLNPLEFTTSLSDYYKILSKLFIPLPMVNKVLFIPFEDDLKNDSKKTVSINLFFDKLVSDKTHEDDHQKKSVVQPELEVYIKPDSEIVRNKEVETLVHKIRNIMALNFGYDVVKREEVQKSGEHTKETFEELDSENRDSEIHENKEELKMKLDGVEDDNDKNTPEESDYSDIASQNEDSDNSSNSNEESDFIDLSDEDETN